MVSTYFVQSAAAHWTGCYSALYPPAPLSQTVLGDLRNMRVIDIPTPGSSFPAPHDTFDSLVCATAPIEKGSEALDGNLDHL